MRVAQIERPPFSPVRVLIPEQLQSQLLPGHFPPPVELERRQVRVLEQVLAPGSELHL